MTRLPVLPTFLVALACAAMIALGVWQLRRADEKAALLTRYATARDLPEMAWPAMPMGDDLLFRRAHGLCLQPVATRVEGGLSAKGESGWRHIVSCRTGAEGPGMIVDIGWSKDFAIKPDWKGGPVSGVIGQEPDKRSLLTRASGGGTVPSLLLVSSTPASGLESSTSPDLRDVPNNHFAYAVQWFIFAAIAAVIYGLVLFRRAS